MPSSSSSPREAPARRALLEADRRRAPRTGPRRRLGEGTRRAILTENWSDYSRLIQQAAAEGRTHYGVVFSSRQKLPRSRETIGLYVRVLDDLLTRHPDADALLDSSGWLPDQPIT